MNIGNIQKWMPETWRYIGQVQNKRTKSWFVLSHDDYNYPDGPVTKKLIVMATRLLGGLDGQPFGTSQPRTLEQIVRLYGPITHGEIC